MNSTTAHHTAGVGTRFFNYKKSLGRIFGAATPPGALVFKCPDTTTGRPERFSTKLEQTHARNFLKDAVEHVLLANPKPCVKRLLNTCLVKNL